MPLAKVIELTVTVFPVSTFLSRSRTYSQPNVRTIKPEKVNVVVAVVVPS